MSEKQEAILPVVPLVPGNEHTGRPLVELTHVEKYFGDLHVLKDINLTVNRGEVLVVVGPSGSGKSTMCRTINRLETIESGDIRIDGKALPQEGRQLAQLRAEVGMVFQSFNLVTRTTVIKNVLSACVPDMPFWRVLLGAFRKEDKLKALESLDKVGILDKAYMRADQLSGGQRQRISLARAILKDAPIVVLDEATAYADPENEEKMEAAIAELVKGKTLVVIAHK